MLLILDVDGVLTDGKKYYDNTGKGIYKTFCDRDFTAIKKFKAAEWNVVFLSGDKNVNEAVAMNRNIPFYCNRENGVMVDKAEFLPIFEKTYNCDPDNMVYVGDDVFDVNIMKNVGYAFCPENAALEVKLVAESLLVEGGNNCISCLYDRLVYLELVSPVTIRQIMDLDLNERF
jgi:3-deoxy-D-manno-octulosonate 8-phosphate phosphatase (KDO 8-P phosphatase)